MSDPRPTRDEPAAPATHRDPEPPSPHGARAGTVHLVGAGPGDPSLITLRGDVLLRTADALVVDTLVHPALLERAAPGAELIDVGKKPGHAPVPQEQITALLVSLARQGRRVVRLKGGDPFIFGRGGEEAAGLADAGIPFEIVPGVTAAIGAAAWAGIPLTLRGVTSTLTFVTGHEDPAKELSHIDWQGLARMGTLAFYMSTRNLPAVAERLQAAGKPADTPAAVIGSGTYAGQLVVTGTLADIAARATDAGVRRPALTIVGPVVRMRERIAWVEKRPLHGRTVLVTRARAQAPDASERLAALGADVVEAPVLELRPPATWAPLDDALRDAAGFDWIVLTSVNGVEALCSRIEAGGLDIRVLGRAKIAAIGPATAEAVRRRLLRVDLVPEKYVAEEVFAALAGRGEVAGRRFLLPRADIARAELPRLLEAAGGRVVSADVYRTVAPDALPARALAAIDAGTVRWVTLTSSSTAANFARLAGADRIARLVSAGARFASIGPITTRTAAASGLPVAVEAAEHTIPGLVDAMVRAERRG